MYVGQTRKTLASRWRKHQVDVRVRRLPLHLAILKHGAAAFVAEQIEECPDDQANDRETWWISAMRTHLPAFGYNANLGGGVKGMTDATREKIRASKMGSLNPMFGRVVPERVRRAISASNVGKHAGAKSRIKSRKDNHYVEALGRNLTITEWANMIGVYDTVILARLRRGWSTADAVSTPARGVPSGRVTTRACDFCHQPFLSHVPKKKYCTDRCNKEAWSSRQEGQGKP